MPEDTASSAWEPEEEKADDVSGNNLAAENINAEVPRSLWDNLLWQTTRVAIDESDTKEEALKKIKIWNTGNSPKLPEKELVQKVLWAFRKWDSKFRRSK